MESFTTQEKFTGGGGGGGRPNLVYSPGPGLSTLVLGPSGPDLGPDLDLTWDLAILIVAAFINKLKTRKEPYTEEACNNVIYYQVRSIASLTCCGCICIAFACLLSD